MRNGHRTSLLAHLAGTAVLLGSFGFAAAGDAGRWTAGADLVAAPGSARETSFLLVQEGSRIRLSLDDSGRTVTAELPEVFVLPLGGQARLQDPWVTMQRLRTRRSPADRGWDLWDGRPAPVHAAASGTVVSVERDQAFGPCVVIDHGAGLRTRTFLGRYGRNAVAAGTLVSAGDVIGELGLGLPDDLPSIHFGILFEASPGERLALDPAPFFFLSPANRALPLAGSILNAAVRAGDAAKVTRLLALGIDPNRKAVDGTRPLEWAIMMRDADMARLLMASGADAQARTAERSGTYLEGRGMTVANTGPTLAEYAEESGDPGLVAAVAGK